MAAVDALRFDGRPDDEDEVMAEDAAEERTRSGLVARAEATDRADRFAQRLAAVEQARVRRRMRDRVLWLLAVVALAGVGALTLVVVAAVTNAPSPSVGALGGGAAVGALVGLVGPWLREKVASRRGAAAWDWHRQRHVLLGDPSATVRDADRPGRSQGPLPPPR